MTDRDYGFQDDGPEPPLKMDDHREPRRRGPAPVTLIVSVLLLVLVTGAVAYLYRGGPKGSGDGPQPLGAPLGDVRIAAPPQPAAQDATAGLSIAKDDPTAASAGAPNFAPPPEQPMPAAGAAQATPSASLPPPPPPPPPPEPMKAAAPPATPSGGAPPSSTKAITPAVTRPAATAAPKLTPAQSAASAMEAPAAMKGAAIVQIGAFSSRALADKGWSAAAAAAPGAMAGKGEQVVEVAKEGKTLYRTSITGFTSRDQAQALCDRLKSAGGTCIVH